MSSKWINKKLFDDYAEEKVKETVSTNQVKRSDFVWTSPKAGTAEKPKVYEGRFIPDKKGKFTKKYMYHMWKSGDKWIFYLCPKTNGMEHFCPICSIVNALYTGTDSDKNVAYKMKRKERHVGNFYIVDDPRDAEIDEEAKKASKKVKLYEFPGKLESKLKNEILDKKEGLGYAIFDPGSEGHNIIIKIKSTKADAKGNTYPDYADSIFSRKAYPLASTDAEIKAIMDSTYSIDDYIKSMEMTKEDTIKLLKSELLWDMIENEWCRHFGADMSTAENVTEQSQSVPVGVEQPEESDVPESVVSDDGDDLDLMAELRNMK